MIFCPHLAGELWIEFQKPLLSGSNLKAAVFGVCSVKNEHRVEPLAKK
jgi:hypothetical protein